MLSTAAATARITRNLSRALLASAQAAASLQQAGGIVHLAMQATASGVAGVARSLAKTMAASASALALRLSSAGKALQAVVSAKISAQHAGWLESVTRLHGLIAPLVNTFDGAGRALARSDGTVLQTIADTDAAVTITTTAAPTGAPGNSALTGEQAAWLEALARMYGVIDPYTESLGQRSDGTVTQTLTQTSTTVTATRVA